MPIARSWVGNPLQAPGALPLSRQGLELENLLRLVHGKPLFESLDQWHESRLAQVRRGDTSAARLAREKEMRSLLVAAEERNEVTRAEIIGTGVSADGKKVVRPDA